MAQSLANKYRSTTFDDLIGQDHISHILKYQVAHHTRQANYLFFGPRGTGKTSSARLFAKAINCLTTTDGNPCNVCENCVAISNNATMDIMEIDAASHTGIDNIREEIIDKLMYRPSMLKKRITIIDEVHMLSKGAFNALLKTMEEPSEWMVFILATTELSKVPDTIISRCQIFNFKKIPSEQIIDRLDYIATKEGIQNNTAGLSLIADLSDGCMRDAVKYLDQISVMGDVNETNVSQFLGVVSDASISNIISLYASYIESNNLQDFDSLIVAIEELSIQGVDLTLLPKQLMHYADRHFNDNRALYSEISTLSAELLTQAKRYPHPLLLYKTLLFREQYNSSQPISQTSAIEKKKIITSPAKEEPVAVISQNIKKEQHISEKQTPLSKDILSEDNNIQQEKTPPSSDIGTTDSHHELWLSVIRLLSPSLQNLLSGQSELVSIEDGKAELIVTNSLAKLTLKKKEVHDSIATAITSQTHKTITSLEFSFMSKEDYFSHQMKF